MLRGDLYAYEGLEKVIVSVGLVRPVKGVFVEDIRWLLVVVTPVEVVLLGVSIDDGSNELTLIPTDIVVSTDGVLMCKVVGTSNGRIFMAGLDGHLYELSYSDLKSSMLGKLFGGGEGGQRRRKRARKVTHNPSFLSSYLVPEAVRAFFAADTRLDDIAYDERRKCLYTLSSTGVISLYKINDGEPGSSLNHVASVNAARDANRHARSVTGAAREIVSLFPTLSPSVHLVAVTSYGERLYYTTAASNRSFGLNFANGGGSFGLNSSSQNTRSGNSGSGTSSSRAMKGLREIGWRGSVGASGGLSSSERPCIHVALWKNGHVLMSDLRENESDMLFGIFPESRSQQNTPDRLIPNSRSYFRENRCIEQVSNISLGNYGEKIRALDLATAGKAANGRGDSELDLPNVRSPSFWVLTEKEIVLFERKSPLELLRSILLSGAGDAAEFFAEHGAAEASAMCVELAVNEPSIAGSAARALYTHGGASFTDDASQRDVKQEQITGPGYDSRPGTHQYGRGPGGIPIFDIGRPVSVRSQHQQFSGVHDGLSLYFAKILSPVWTRFILTSRDSKAYPKLGAATGLISMVRGHLLSLVQFLNEYSPETMQESYAERNGAANSDSTSEPAPFARTPRGLVSTGREKKAATLQDRLYRGLYKLKKANERRRMEHFAITGLKELALRASEGLALILVLDEHQLHRLLATASQDVRETFCNMRYCDLIAGEVGPYIASALLEALFSSYTDESSVIEHIGRVLHERCPSFFGNDDRSLHHGLGLLRQAVKEHQILLQQLDESTSLPRPGPGLSAVLQKAEQATKVLSEVAGRIPDLAGVCRSFAEVGAHASLVTVALAVANDAEAAADNDRVDVAYRLIFTYLEGLFSSSGGPGDGELWKKEEVRAAALKVALGSNSDAFHNKLYDFLLKSPSGEAELLRHPTARIIKFLEVPGRENLLWRCLVQQDRYSEAAQVLIRMAESGDGHDGVSSLANRVNNLTCAVHNAKTAVSSGDQTAAAVLAEASDLLDVAQVQMRLRNKLRGLPRTDNIGEAIEALSGKILDLSTLYNSYAGPLELWENALDILNCGNHEDESLVVSILEKLLKRETQTDVEGIVVDKVSALGRMLYPGPAFSVSMVLRLLANEAFTRNWSDGSLWTAMNNSGVPWGATIDAFRALRESGSWLMEEKLVWLTNALLAGLNKNDVRGRDREAAHELVASLKARLRGLSARNVADIIRKLDTAEQNWNS